MNSIKCVHKYTYDIYGRQHTRSFDTDFSKGKEGFERTETYHYNEQDELVRLDRDTLGQGGDIDAYVTYERDVYGREDLRKQYSNGILENSYTNEYDAYGYIIKAATLNGNEQITRLDTQTRDARGFDIKTIIDWNGDGIFNNNDTIIVVERSDSHDGRVLVWHQSYATGAPETYMIFDYDELERRVVLHTDSNKNGVIDEGERNTKISYLGTSTNRDILETYFGDEFQYLQKYHYNDNSQVLGSFYAGKDKVYYRLAYEGVGGSLHSSKEDYTDSRYAELFEQVGGTLKTLDMSNANYKTDITLDNNVLAKLTQSELVVNGEGTDTIRLKDSNEFKQLANVTRGRQEYEQYQTEVDGQTYTLLIDTDINVIPM